MNPTHFDPFLTVFSAFLVMLSEFLKITFEERDKRSEYSLEVIHGIVPGKTL